MSTLDANTLKAALSHIPANNREDWLSCGMALKAELGDAGFDLFNDWSATADNYDAKAVLASWKSFKAGGKITIASLLRLAKNNGFDVKQIKPAAPLTALQVAQAKQAQIEQEQQAAVALVTLHNAGAVDALQRWEAGKDKGFHAYLNTKKVNAYGVRYAPYKLLVPVRDAAGKLWNIQSISNNGAKYFIKGGRVSGCFHLIGDVAPINAAQWILIAEGYATAASLHSATGYPVAVAFNAHNLQHVAAALRQLHPSKNLLICADDDAASANKLGFNTGIKAAQQAAQSVSGFWCQPVGLLEKQSDFNDLINSIGADAVKAQIMGVMDAALTVSCAINDAINQGVKATTAQTTQQDKSQALPPHVKPVALVHSINTAIAPPAKTEKPKTKRAASNEPPNKPFFTSNKDGVFYHGFHDGEPVNAVKICSELHIKGLTRDGMGEGWGYMLEFNDRDNKKVVWILPAKMLAGDGNAYRAELLDRGLSIEPSLKAKNHLSTYIQTSNSDVRIRCVDRVGWHGNHYVLADKTISNSTADNADTEIMIFQSTGGAQSKFKQQGTLQDWQDNVSKYCQGNSRLAFCVSVGFASTLLHHAGIASGGFHLHGESSTGKSTAIVLAGSVFGGHDYKRSWRLTDNALESVAASHSDGLLLLDEIAQIEPKIVGDSVYMLANEQGKSRATQNSTAKKVLTWRLMFLSDGEVSLANHMQEAGKSTKGGHDVRMVHITADAGQGLGVFDTLHDAQDSAELAAHLAAQTGKYYGVAGIDFIQKIADDLDSYKKQLPQAVTGMIDEYCPPNSHGQVKRVAARFALVGLAGELATVFGITGWTTGEAEQAAKTCFNDWLLHRGGAGNIELDNMRQLLPNFISTHGGSRFAWWNRASDDHTPNTINRAGFKRLVSKDGKAISSNADYLTEFGNKVHTDDNEAVAMEYFIFPDVFQKEICKGFDYKKVASLYVELGMLIPTRIDGKFKAATRSERLPTMGNVRCYKIAQNFMDLAQ